jgi:L,D-transpeptidase-like protein
LYRVVVPLFLFVLILAFSSDPAQCGIVVTVDKSAQRLTVVVDGADRYQWPVSTGRWGYSTPNGSYRPQRLERKWFSRKYDMSPMPYSIFFDGGYAIHGSYEVSRLGRPASHGCIRLSPSNASVLFALVKDRTDDTRIVVTGEAPAQRARARTIGKPLQTNPMKIISATRGTAVAPGTTTARARTGSGGSDRSA